LEHVLEDERFVGQIADLLSAGGYGVLTCDYNDSYKVGDRIPAVDQRFYTQLDLYRRILPAMHKCTVVGTPQWDCSTPDFTYDGCQYTFATLTVRKGR
jgi:hypothetical protein